jgi:hypothetical protein
MDSYLPSTGFGINMSTVDKKFKIVEASVNVSSKVTTKVKRPNKSYIDIEFKKDGEPTFFSYLVFQNFYCH